MQRALSFRYALRALQLAHPQWSPEVYQRIQLWRDSTVQGSAASSSFAKPAKRRAAWAASAHEALSAATEELSPASTPTVPLCERPALHSAPLADLLAWRQAAERLVAAVGDSWAREDDGPSVEDLQTELNWLLDDALTALARAGSDWHSTSWRQLERDLRSKREVEEAACQYVVQLREPLEVLEALWQQRLQERVPLQYLTCCAFWRDVVLSVGPGVLIPRPETELMIDFVEEAVAAVPELAAGSWADLGTGSGALAVGVARALPQAQQVYAVDLSPTPLAYAAFNAHRLGVASRLTPLRGSWYEPLEAAGVRQLAGIVSNPPYIPSRQMRGLQAEVGRYEPQLALHGGEGLGIDCLLPICTGAARLLQPGGFLALETAGGEQAHYIAELLRHMRSSVCGASFMGSEAGSIASSYGSGASSSSSSDEGSWSNTDVADEDAPAFCDVRVRRDLRGVDRFVTATRCGRPASGSTSMATA